MDRVRIYLRTPLFTARTGAHLPAGAHVLTGQVRSQEPGGLVVAVSDYADADGRTLSGFGTVLYLPTAKIDHAELLEGA